MIRDITLGQFYPGNSVIHRLDPRIKIMATLLYIVALFVVKDFAGFIAPFVLLEAVIIMARVPRRYIWRGLRPVLIIIAFTLAINLFMVRGEVLWQLGILHITREGVHTAVFMGIRLVLLIIGSTMLTLTTRPIGLTDGIEALLSPFKKIGLPAHELAMMMTIALRFIPTLLEETDKIMKAQMARGADFESGNLISRAKAMVPLLVPLFVSAFRRAGDLAMAMESRCYHGGEGRTRLRVLKVTKNDWLACGAMAALLALIILEGIFL